MNSLISKTLAAFLLLIAPIRMSMIAVGILITIDLITGIWRAIKAKEKITSDGLRRTISKCAGYQLAIVTAFVVEKYLVDFPIIHPVAAFIGLTEGTSILENISIITGIDFWQAFKHKVQPSKKKKH